MWLPSFPVWSKHFRVYAVDTIGDPGFSATTRPSLHGDEHALWIEDVLGGLHLEHTSIIGASLGGWIGLDFALRHPGVVSSLVLFAPGGITGLRGMIRLEITCLMLMGAWGRRRALLRMFGLLDSSLTDDQRAFLAFCGVAQLNVLSRIRVPAPIVDERLKMLSVRTLVVLGGRDIFFKTEVVRQRFQDLCSTVSVYVVPEAGHMAVDPTKFVQDFLLGHP
jgi:pimeloyl-ACP methyl ester carboxylesterase